MPIIRFSLYCETKASDRILVCGSHASLGAWNPTQSQVELRRTCGALWRAEWRSGLGHGAPPQSPLELYVADFAPTLLATADTTHSEQDPNSGLAGAGREPVIFKFVVQDLDGSLRWENSIGNRMLPAETPWIGSVEVYAEFDQPRPTSKIRKALIRDLEDSDDDEADSVHEAGDRPGKAELRHCLAALGMTAQEEAVLRGQLGAATIEDVCALADAPMDALNAIARHCTTPMQLLSVKKRLRSRAHVVEAAGPLKGTAHVTLHSDLVIGG
mmetsp:Transcript_95539/g.246997  ORF Transcript_95539/g.246997 Transcript_95539/m.246997 type:complete len:271 (-) Transcript_95539:377-1189(-)